MLTTFDLDEYVYAAMRAGASGFLLKDTPKRELVEAVRIIADGNALLAPSVTKRLIEEFSRQTKPEAAKGALPDNLTEREHQTLGLLARGMNNREIAAECTSAKPRSKPTSADSSPNSASATESKPSSSPTRPASHNPAQLALVDPAFARHAM